MGGSAFNVITCCFIYKPIIQNKDCLYSLQNHGSALKRASRDRKAQLLISSQDWVWIVTVRPCLRWTALHRSLDSLSPALGAQQHEHASFCLMRIPSTSLPDFNSRNIVGKENQLQARQKSIDYKWKQIKWRIMAKGWETIGSFPHS